MGKNKYGSYQSFWMGRTRIVKISFFLKITVLAVLVVLSVGSYAISANMHPANVRLVQLGFMPPPKYFPEVPRIPAYYAKKLWENGEARFFLVSHSSLHLIVGGIHLGAGTDFYNLDFPSLKVIPGDTLVFY